MVYMVSVGGRKPAIAGSFGNDGSHDSLSLSSTTMAFVTTSCVSHETCTIVYFIQGGRRICALLSGSLICDHDHPAFNDLRVRFASPLVIEAAITPHQVLGSITFVGRLGLLFGTAVCPFDLCCSLSSKLLSGVAW